MAVVYFKNSSVNFHTLSYTLPKTRYMAVERHFYYVKKFILSDLRMSTTQSSVCEHFKLDSVGEKKIVTEFFFFFLMEKNCERMRRKIPEQNLTHKNLG